MGVGFRLARVLVGLQARAIPDEVVCRADAGVWAPDDEGLRQYEGGPKLIIGTTASTTICRGVGHEQTSRHVRYSPQSGHSSARFARPLSAISRLRCAG